MAAGNYFVLKDLRNIVDIEDTLDDSQLNLFGKSANQEIDTKLFGFSSQLPLTGDLLDYAKSAALYFVASKWKAKKGNDKLAEFYDKQYNKAINTLIERLQASPSTNPRTRRVSVQTDEVTKPLFSQTKKL